MEAWCGGSKRCRCLRGSRNARQTEESINKDARDGEVSGKSHENEAISGFPYRDEVGPTPSGVAGVVRDGKDEKIVPMEAYRYLLAGVREDKMEIPDQSHHGEACLCDVYGVEE